MTSFRLYTDGACWGNPGEAAAGVAILDSKDKKIYSAAVYLGEATNNIAEYSAILEGLRAALRINISSIYVYSDSELIIKQLNGEYKIKSEPLKILNEKITILSEKFDSITFNHIKREYTDIAHNLAEQMLKSRSNKGAAARSLF